MSSGKDSVRQTFIVAVTLCLVASVLVSGAAVMLKPTQIRNQTLDQKKNILLAAGLLDPGGDFSVERIEDVFDQVEPRVVNLESGEYAADVDPASFDQRTASRDPATSRSLDASEDVASIGRRPEHASVYLLKDPASGAVSRVILPVHGYGLWSTMYGYLALETDTRTVAGLTFYEQGETAGLGSEVANPQWLSLWPGKQVFDDNWKTEIRVVKGSVDAQSPKAAHQVDGLAGATLTANGVTNLMQFWLGDLGFGPFLAKFRESEGSVEGGASDG